MIGFLSIIVWRFTANKPSTLSRQVLALMASGPASNSLGSSKIAAPLSGKSHKIIPNKTNTELTVKQKKAAYVNALSDLQSKFVDLRTTVNQGDDYQDRYMKSEKSCELLATIYQNNVSILTEINDLITTINQASSSVKKKIRMQSELLVLKNQLSEWNRAFSQAYPDVASMHGTGCEVNSKAGYLSDNFSNHLDEQILYLKMTMMFTK